jgi:hypothetical protein
MDRRNRISAVSMRDRDVLGPENQSSEPGDRISAPPDIGRELADPVLAKVTREAESTETPSRGGLLRSSDEAGNVRGAKGAGHSGRDRLGQPVTGGTDRS